MSKHFVSKTKCFTFLNFGFFSILFLQLKVFARFMNGVSPDGTDMVFFFGKCICLLRSSSPFELGMMDLPWGGYPVSKPAVKCTHTPFPSPAQSPVETSSTFLSLIRIRCSSTCSSPADCPEEDSAKPWTACAYGTVQLPQQGHERWLGRGLQQWVHLLLKTTKRIGAKR